MTNKILRYALFLLPVLCCYACSSTMYQVVETSATGSSIKTEATALVYENDDLKVAYSFWSPNGRIYFTLYNKTAAPIFIDWSKSHLVHNGTSLDYWKDEEKTTGIFNAAATTLQQVRMAGRNSVMMSMSSSSGSAAITTTKPIKITHLPPNSNVAIGVFDISKRPFFDCDFKLKPTSLKNLKTKTFTKDDSPVVFRNYLSYSNTENSTAPKTIDNEFYIASAKNVSRSTFRGKNEALRACDDKGRRTCDYCPVYPFQQPNTFFIKIRR